MVCTSFFPFKAVRAGLIPALLLCWQLETSASGALHGTGWVEQSYTYAIHKPWNLDVSERYLYIPATKEHRFWIYKDDEPFNETSSTSPRCEMRIKNNYTSGNHQFEADFYAVEGSHRVSVMQAWLGFQLILREENNGSLYCWKRNEELINNIYNTWIHLNVVHIMDEGDPEKGGTVYVYLNGELAAAVDANITSDEVYFKCGVYTTHSERSEVRIRNIKIYEQSTNTAADKPRQRIGDPVFDRQAGILRVDPTACTRVDVYDLQGRKIQSTSDTEIRLPSRGVFIVKLSGEDRSTFIKKIVN